MNSAQARAKDNLKGLQGNTSIPMQGSQSLSPGAANPRSATPSSMRTTRRGSAMSTSTLRGNGGAAPTGSMSCPVPRTLVEIEPLWHGYLYFVYEDEIVIVNPRDMRIVAVLPV